ncbi:MAG TPA: hypothetical protein IAD26_00265 [Candidatus Limenecus avicola]|uniref:Uncharacterized protein n=1 Tax=Candidatus Limenecus avicola TaxID=2840847 RepID=A0A9D1MXW0_9CLOT|nr:hypothetical protein [Candidatus Limenecus avicola]
MSMNFDTYATSFQSLMSPMYNLSTNYNATINNGAVANSGANAGNGTPGAGGYGNYSAYGFMSPMTNIGIGQFNADHLVKGDDKINNYYARPIATHKTKDELPTILGILGTALGTAALITALCKGRGAEAAKKAGTYLGKTKGNKIKYTVPPRQVSRRHVKGQKTNPTVTTSGVPTTNTPTTIPQPATSNWAPKPVIYKNGTRKALPYSTRNKENITATLLPPQTAAGATKEPAQIKGLLPQRTARQQAALAKQEAAMNLPSSGQVWADEIAPKAQQVVETSQAAATQNLPAQIYKFDGLDKLQKAATGEYVYAPVDKEALKQVVFGQQNKFRLPERTVVTETAPQTTNIKGLLPQRTAKQQAALAKQEAAMNLPSSGQVWTFNGKTRNIE